MKKIFEYILVVGGFGSLVLAIASVSTPVWIQDGVQSVGLWEECFENICDYFVGPSNIQATQAFFILGCILLLPFIGLSAYKITETICNIKLVRALLLCNFLADFFFLIAMIVYTSTVSMTNTSNYGYSFILGWFVFAIGFLLFILSGLVYWSKKEL